MLLATHGKRSHRQSYFRIFKAMRRALRYLRKATPIPRVFGLFTDTTSRLDNFQPRSSEDLSSRITKLPVAGMKQFDPIYVFTSIDAHARTVHNNYTTSNAKQVAIVERLLKFGRAGWYSLYSGKSKSAPGERMYDKRNLRELAISKLLGGLDGGASLNRQLVPAHLTPKTRLCLLAVIASRLALTIGPFSAEAAEVISFKSPSSSPQNRRRSPFPPNTLPERADSGRSVRPDHVRKWLALRSESFVSPYAEWNCQRGLPGGIIVQGFVPDGNG